MAAVQSLGRAHRGDHTPVRSVLEGVLACLALFATAGGVVTLVSPPSGQVVVAQLGPATALAMLAVTCALVATGTIAWFARSQRGLALIALCAAAAWAAMEMERSTSVTPEARSVSTVLAPFFVPLAVHLALRSLAADRWREPPGLLLAMLYAAVAATSLGAALTYDPFFDVDCVPLCSHDNSFLVWQDARLASAMRSLGLGASVVGALGLVVWGTTRISRRRTAGHGAAHMVAIASVVLGASLACWSAVRMLATRSVPADPALILTAIAVSAGVVLVTVAVVRLVAGELRRAEALRRLAAAIGSGAATSSLRETLARTLDDDRLRVVYPLEDGGVIDDQGSPAELPRPGDGRAVTTIVRGDRRIAIVGHEAGVDPEVLDREIGAAARLAVDNERLEATIRARLRELQASRARIVEAADLARGRLERDLHDGAQQRLLAVSFELRLAAAALSDAAAADARAGLEGSIDDLDRALSELRDLAHGIHPVVLAEDGLAGALASLAEEAPVPLTMTGEAERCAPPVELAAYLAVVEAMRRAESAGAERLDVDARTDDGRLCLRIAGRGLADESSWVRIEDRVGAAGGRMSVADGDGATGATVVSVELPCA